MHTLTLVCFLVVLGSHDYTLSPLNPYNILLYDLISCYWSLSLHRTYPMPKVMLSLSYIPWWSWLHCFISCLVLGIFFLLTKFYSSKDPCYPVWCNFFGCTSSFGLSMQHFILSLSWACKIGLLLVWHLLETYVYEDARMWPTTHFHFTQLKISSTYTKLDIVALRVLKRVDNICMSYAPKTIDNVKHMLLAIQ